MIEEGDKYIHFTKRGGINRGIVKSIGTVNVIDTNNKVSYTTYYMINEKNVQYQLDGTDGRFYKISQEYTDDEAKNLGDAFLALAELKQKRKKEVLKDFVKDPSEVTLKNTNIDNVIKTKFDEDNLFRP